MAKATKRDKKIRATLFITYTAILIAIDIVLNVIDIPLAVGSVKLTFTYIPCFFAGIFLGPIAGFLVGLLGDILGFLINSQGMAWIPLITISSSLIGLIPGLVFKIPKLKVYFKFLISFLLVFLVCTCCLSTLGTYFVFAIGKKTFWVYLIGRIGPQFGFYLINCAIISALYYPLKRYVFAKLNGKTATAEDIEKYEEQQNTLVADNTQENNNHKKLFKRNHENKSVNTKKESI